MIEKHPFDAFVPRNMCCLIIGSFPGKEQTLQEVEPHHWFYGAPRNQFWKILAKVYNRTLTHRKEKQQLFEEAGIGIVDIIKAAVRTKGNNLDENLEIKEYNTEVIGHLLETYQPQVFFTSRFVEKTFKKFFPGYIKTDLLPSPSPRYFKLSVEDKAKVYMTKLPELP